MKNNGVVFLDLPRLPPPGSAGYIKDEATAENLARSLDLSQFSLRKDEAALEKFSEIISNNYQGARWSQRRSLALGWINGLYSEAKVGDVIVVPAPAFVRDPDGNTQTADTLIGEISGGPERWIEGAPEEYRNARYLVRRVKWFESVSENDLSFRSTLSLRTQNALVRLRAEHLDQVLGAAYKNVMLDDEFLARFLTRNADFRSFEAYHFLGFVMGCTAAYRAFESKETLEGTSLYEIAARLPRDLQFVAEQDASIHSPGYSTLKATRLTPFVTMCLFSIAVSGDAQPFDEDGRADVQVINSESLALDPCAPDIGVDEAVRETLNIIGYDRWQRFCEAALHAHEHEGFEPQSEVVHGTTQ
ncbi:hypothetical protein LSUCC0031_13595 [Rhodobacterales bacterium LSUCC0031]|nr:hypothetical protein [Rhodobacterales bacterium LSUCC0031]